MKRNIRRARTCDVAFQYRMPAGIPGAVNRASSANVEAAIVDATLPPASYGLGLVIDGTSHNVRIPKSGDTANSIYGMYVRPYPTGGSATDGLGTSTPPGAGSIANVLKRGYMTVKLNGATAAAKGGTVFVRILTGTGTVIGGIEAAADSTNTVTLPSNWYFTGPADASGNVEIAVNI